MQWGYYHQTLSYIERSKEKGGCEEIKAKKSKRDLRGGVFKFEEVMMRGPHCKKKRGFLVSTSKLIFGEREREREGGSVLDTDGG